MKKQVVRFVQDESDANRDQGSDQAIFDRRGTRLILYETHDLLLHDNSPVYSS